MQTELATIDAPIELRESVAECVQWSNDNIIEGPALFQAFGEHLKQIKTRQKQADDFFDPPIKQAHELHKMLVGRKKLITDPLATSERIDKQKMLAYQQAEQQKAESERRRLQAIADEQARKEREKAEQEAARQRQIEAEQRAKAEQARLAAQEADAAERKKLLAEAEAADRKAAAAAIKVETQVENAAVVTAPVIQVATAAPTVKGIATKRVWKYRISDASKIPREYMIPDDAKLSGMARALKGSVPIAGVEFFSEESLSSGRY